MVQSSHKVPNPTLQAQMEKAWSLTSLCVQKSVTDARANWGIPKELAEFEWKEPSSDEPGRVTVRHCSNGSRGDLIFDVTFHDNYSPISVPVFTKVPLLPSFDVLNWLPLVQLCSLPLRGELAWPMNSFV